MFLLCNIAEDMIDSRLPRIKIFENPRQFSYMLNFYQYGIRKLYGHYLSVPGFRKDLEGVEYESTWYVGIRPYKQKPKKTFFSRIKTIYDIIVLCFRA